MKKILLLFTVFQVLIYTCVHAQVGIGTTNPNSSARLEVSANDRGVLIPRITTAQRNAISNPANGLTIYNTDDNAFWYYNGSRWVSISHTGIEIDTLLYIAGTYTTLPLHLISLINAQFITDSAGIVYDTGGDMFNYNNNENYSFSLSSNDAIGYRFIVNYDIAASDSLIISDYITSEPIAIYTNASGTDTVFFDKSNIDIRFVSNGILTAPGFVLQFNQIYEAGPGDALPSVAGPWYYRPAQHAVMGGLHILPNSQLNMGNHSIGYGKDVIASGNYSAAFGYHSIAAGNHAFAVGSSTKALGQESFAAGINTEAGVQSFVAGLANKAIGTSSSAWGRETISNGTNTVTTGIYTQADGFYSFAMGYDTKAKSYASVVLGRYNDTSSNLSSGWVATDPLLIAGNGASSTNRSNAFTLYKNGNLTIAGTLTQNSDARLKTNILRITNAMEKLRLLNGYQYNWNTSYSDNQELNTGLLAQEIEKLMPELILKDGNGILSVDYNGMIPYLLEGIKNLQTEIETLQKTLDEL